MLSETTKLQRYLSTEFITKRRLALPTVWLKPEGIVPSPEDVVADSIFTDLDAWTDQNLGVRLVDGHIELRIKAPDDIWASCLFEAFAYLQVDGRAAYGAYQVSSIIIKIDDPETIDSWEHRWPRGHTDKEGQKVTTKVIYSAVAMPRSKAIWRVSAPLPGSRVAGDTVLWRPRGKPPADLPELGLEDLEMVRPLAATNMESICRAIAYATLLYWISDFARWADRLGFDADPDHWRLAREARWRRSSHQYARHEPGRRLLGSDRQHVSRSQSAGVLTKTRSCDQPIGRVVSEC